MFCPLFTSEVKFLFLKYLFDKLTHCQCDRFCVLAVLLEINFALYSCTFQFLIFSLKYFLQTHTWHIVSVKDFVFFYCVTIFWSLSSLKYFFYKLTLGTLSVWQTPSLRSRSLISQENTLGHSAFVLQKVIFYFAKKLFTAQHLLFSSHLVFWDLFDHSWRGNPRFWATDLTGLDAAGLVVPATNNYNVERQWKLQGVTSAQGKFYLVLRRKFHQSLV